MTGAVHSEEGKVLRASVVGGHVARKHVGLVGLVAAGREPGAPLLLDGEAKLTRPLLATPVGYAGVLKEGLAGAIP